MRFWGLVFKPRGGIAGTGFGAAVVASVVSACAPIRLVLLPGRKTREHSACGSGSSPLPAQECGVWARGRGERGLSSLLATAEKQGNDSLKANHYPQVMLCCVLRARYY